MTSLELREHAKPLEAEISLSSSLGDKIWANVALATAQAFQRFWQRQERLDAAYDARCQKPKLLPQSTATVGGGVSAAASAVVADSSALVACSSREVEKEGVGGSEEGSGSGKLALSSTADAAEESTIAPAGSEGEDSISSSAREGAESVALEMASHAAAEMEDLGLKAELTTLAQAQEYDDLNPKGKLLVSEQKVFILEQVNVSS